MLEQQISSGTRRAADPLLSFSTLRAESPQEHAHLELLAGFHPQEESREPKLQELYIAFT